MDIPVLHDDFRLGLGNSQQKGVGFDPTQGDLGRFPNDFSEFTSQL
jgi:hypothetical protein